MQCASELFGFVYIRVKCKQTSSELVWPFEASFGSYPSSARDSFLQWRDVGRFSFFWRI